MYPEETLAMVIGAVLLAFLFLMVATYIVFTAWMLIHSLIRTVKMWPEENALNIVMILMIFVLEIIGAIVYYFVCYRKSSVLAKPA